MTLTQISKNASLNQADILAHFTERKLQIKVIDLYSFEFHYVNIFVVCLVLSPVDRTINRGPVVKFTGYLDWFPSPS